MMACIAFMYEAKIKVVNTTRMSLAGKNKTVNAAGIEKNVMTKMNE